MNKEQYLDELFNRILNKHPELNSMLSYAKEFYMNDERDLYEIEKEIEEMIKKYEYMESLVNKSIDKNVLDNSIILIGPMCAGKSTISNDLANKTNLERISLDARDKLKKYYQEENKFSNFKDFELYLTASVLTNLDSPKIIDFGAGHSIYENPLMFMEFKKLIDKFSNVVLVMPSENKEESIQITTDRLIKRNGMPTNQKLEDNKHFIESPCNYEIATITEYTLNKDVNSISNDILKKIDMKKNDFVEYTEYKNKEISDIKALVSKLQELNPNADIRLGNPQYLNDFDSKFYSSIPMDKLNLPQGFSYNEKNGITNKHKSETGTYISAKVGSLDSVNQAMLMPKNNINQQSKNVINKGNVVHQKNSSSGLTKKAKEKTSKPFSKRTPSELKIASQIREKNKQIATKNSKRNKLQNNNKAKKLFSKRSKNEIKIASQIRTKNKTIATIKSKNRQVKNNNSKQLRYNKPSPSKSTGTSMANKGYINIIIMSLVIITITILVIMYLR